MASSMIGFTYIWKIENFPYCLQKKGERLESPQFSVDTIEPTDWRVCLYPRGLTDDNFIGYSIQYVGGPQSVVVDYEVSFTATKKSTLRKSVKSTNKWIEVQKESEYFTFIRREAILETGRDAFLPDDTLTVRFRIWRRDKEFTEPGLCCARTKIGVERKSFIWAIEKFASLHTGDAKKIQVRFATNLLSTKLFWSGGTICDQLLQIEVRRLHNNRRTFAYSEASVLDKNGDAGVTVQSEFWFSNGVTDKELWYYPPLLNKTNLLRGTSSYLQDDVLHLRLDYVVSDGVELSKVEDTRYGRRYRHETSTEQNTST